MNRQLVRVGFRISAGVALAACVVMGAGCGTSATSAVESGWHAAANNLANGNGAGFCADISTGEKVLVASLSSDQSCPKAVTLLANSLTAAEKQGIRSAVITKVTIKGNKATVTVKSTPALQKIGFAGTSTMIKSNGKWVLATSSGT